MESPAPEAFKGGGAKGGERKKWFSELFACNQGNKRLHFEKGPPAPPGGRTVQQQALGSNCGKGWEAAAEGGGRRTWVCGRFGAILGKPREARWAHLLQGKTEALSGEKEMLLLGGESCYSPAESAYSLARRALEALQRT